MKIEFSDCCYYYCRLEYLNNILLYFAFKAMIAALHVTMEVRKKSYISYNAVMSLCMQLQSM